MYRCICIILCMVYICTNHDTLTHIFITLLTCFFSTLASDILDSIYFLSDCEIRGCVAGLSNPSNNQNMNHMIPIIPVINNKKD